MKKAAESAGLVVKNIIFIGYTLQIGLGLVWMGANLGSIQDFLPVDTGVYCLFYHLPKWAYTLVYLLQLGAALYAGCRLVQKLCSGGRGLCLWGSLALMTLPMAMQCHMALLPYSFVCSLELLKLSFTCELAGKGEGTAFPAKALAGVLVCFGLQCLLWPGYSLPGAVLPFLLLLWKLPGLLRRKELTVKGLLLVFCFLAVTAAGWGAEKGREDFQGGRSGWCWPLVKRVCWPTLWADWGERPDEIGLETESVIWQSAYYPYYMEIYFKPALAEAVTPEAAEAIMKKMVKYAWQVHYPMVVRQMGWDVLGYGVTPLILPLQLAGEAYDSCSGRNYEVMRNETPILTKYYVRTACGWFAASLVLLFTGAVLKVTEKQGESSRGSSGELSRNGFGRVPWLFSALAVLFSAGMVILFFTMQGAGIMDYKYTVWINQLWILGSIKIVRGKKKERQVKGNEIKEIAGRTGI